MPEISHSSKKSTLRAYTTITSETGGSSKTIFSSGPEMRRTRLLTTGSVGLQQLERRSGKFLRNSLNMIGIES